MHSSEEQKSTSTARLLQMACPDVEIQYVGRLNVPCDLSWIDARRRETFLLYPEVTAQVLDSSFAQQHPEPVTLIVPDGTWKQARKITHRVEELRGVSRLRLACPAPSAYRLRRNQLSGTVCTIEAVAQALGILEGEGVQRHLEGHFDRMVARVLWSRRTSQKYVRTASEELSEVDHAACPQVRLAVENPE